MKNKLDNNSDNGGRRRYRNDDGMEETAKRYYKRKGKFKKKLRIQKSLKLTKHNEKKHEGKSGSASFKEEQYKVETTPIVDMKEDRETKEE